MTRLPGALAILSASVACAAQAPDLNEVLDILRTNPPVGMSATDINATAVRGVISAFGPKVSLVNPDETRERAGKLVTKANVFDSTIGYIRIEEFEANLAEAAVKALKDAIKTNKIEGIVLDLRFAQGDNYASAAALVDSFLSTSKPLIDWGDGMKSSKGKPQAPVVPVAVLVNEQTAGAAEAAAGVFRETGTGLIIGSRTAGASAIPREFKLSGGQILRIGSGAIELGNGTKLTGPIKPDIQVDVRPDDEKVYFADAFAVVQRPANFTDVTSTNGTNRVTRRTRFSEADLVREHSSRTGGEGVSAREDKPETPVVNDPALARAIDVLKGLAVVRQSRL